jgi:hypothetical protein
VRWISGLSPRGGNGACLEGKQDTHGDDQRDQATGSVTQAAVGIDGEQEAFEYRSPDGLYREPGALDAPLR